MLGKTNELFKTGTSAEDQMKMNVIRYDTEEVHQKKMYYDCAQKVIFRNCMGVCDLDDKKLPNFNRKFYYHMEDEKHCLQTCYNARVDAHFGPETALKEHLYFDFARLKIEYMGYERWSPISRHAQTKEFIGSKEYIDNLTASLVEKTKQARKESFN